LREVNAQRWNGGATRYYTFIQACHEGYVIHGDGPRRLDLDLRWPERALELGCVMSTNPDAIDLTHWGVEMARKGGVPANRALNCLTLPQLMLHLRKRKTAQAGAA
jgi:DNA polymerase (family X)